MSKADPLARAVFALLVAACFAAFFVTQRLKHTPTVVQRFKLAPFISPYPGGHHPLEAISFELSSADLITVSVIDSGGSTVATLFHDLPAQRYKTISLRWNGRRGNAFAYTTTTSASGKTISLIAATSGSLAAPGEYRIRVHLRRKGKTVESPHSFTLVGP